MAHFLLHTVYDAPLRPGASRLTISLHSRQADQSACRVICWLARLVGNPSRVVTRRSHASESPLKGFLIEDCQLCDTFQRSHSTHARCTDRLDRLDGLALWIRAETGCLHCLPRTTLLCLPICRRLVGARAQLLPDILTGGPSLLDAKRILSTCAILSMAYHALGYSTSMGDN